MRHERRNIYVDKGKGCMSYKNGRISYALVVAFASIAMARASDTSVAVEPNSEWALIGNNAYQQHFSPLTQINDHTVTRLGLTWYADLPTKDGPAGVPLVAGGVIYQSGTLGKVFANDVRTGKLLWSFDAHLQFPMGVVPSWGSRLTRGVAVWEDEVITATGDCRLIALNRQSGQKIWESQVCDPTKSQSITAAPRVGDGKVFIGNTNADTGISRPHVDALDARTGRHLWRFYTIPGDPAKGFESKAMEMASKTWGKDYWKTTGGGSPWDGITYDPRLNLVFIGTDGPAPFVPSLRAAGRGDELFTTCIVALNADTGEYVWHYQTTPEDGWNFDATAPLMIADLVVNKQKRHVVMQAPKNGFFYVLDAKTGALINQPKPIVPVNWASHIDMKTGRPVQLAAAQYWQNAQHESVVAPSPIGAHNWMPMSFNPRTGLVYLPVMEMVAEVSIEKGNALGDMDINWDYPLEHKLPFKGSVLAWDPVKQQERWRRDVGLPYEGGTLSTAGNLVFEGTTHGELIAFRADSGEKVWSIQTGSRILAAPVTVTVDGEQTLIVASGPSSTSSLLMFHLMGGDPGGRPRLLAFKLDAKEPLPPLQPPSRVIPKPPRPRPELALAEQGRAIWDANSCDLCHGYRAVADGGSVPDLRKASAETHDTFAAIVLGGLRKDKGMPVFAESIKADELPALEAYILQQAWQAYDAQQAEGSHR
jgi:PQQ-dependent dehydrogenase (methanol/ethanol family)